MNSVIKPMIKYPKRDITYVYFNVTGYGKFINMASLQLNFRKLPLSEFWCNIEEEYSQLFLKAIKILPFFPNYISVLDFLYIFQPKQFMTTDYYVQKHVWKSNYLLMGQILKIFVKMWKIYLFSIILLFWNINMLFIFICNRLIIF